VASIGRHPGQGKPDGMPSGEHGIGLQTTDDHWLQGVLVVKVAAWLLLPLFVAPCAHAANWQICRMEVEITETVTQPYPGLKGRIESVQAQATSAECPIRGEVIAFEPESADYQSMIPRKRWPKPGERVRMRYQYLDGQCKNDGNTKPCRIQHYPMGW